MVATLDGGSLGTELAAVDGGVLGSSWSGRIDGQDAPPPTVDPGNPTVPPTRRGYLSLDLIDRNGVVWDLASGPVRLTTAGLEGLGLPTIEWQESEAPGVDGQRTTGWRLKARDLFLPVRFKGAAATDTTGVQRKWWDGIRLGSFVTFRVTDRDGAQRSITMKLKDDGGMKYKIQPDLATIDAIGLTFTADDPWWYGEPVKAMYVFDSDEGADFFGGDAGAPDFYISPGSGSSGQLKLRNPGDAPAWLVWTVVGDTADSFSFDVGGHAIASSQPIAGGSTLVIDTDPRVQTARLDGQRYPFRLFDSIDFAQVPDGGEQVVSIALVGSGSITGEFRPRYLRGF